MNRLQANKKFYQIMMCVVILCLILSVGSAAYGKGTTGGVAIDGIMDLREWNSQADKSIELNGQWEFYWEELLEPHELESQRRQDKKYINVPGSWNSYVVGGKSVGGDGFATYKLTILVPQDTETTAIRLPSIYTSHKLWVNGKLVSEQGRVAKSKGGSNSLHYRVVVPLEQVDGRIVLVLQVSNFMHRMGGLWSPIVFGSNDYIKNAYDRSMAVDIFIFGVLLSLGMFYLAFYLIRNHEKAALYFGLFCLMISLRAISVGNILIVRFFDFISQEAALRLEYITFYGGIAAFAGFIKFMFLQEVSKTVWTIAKTVALIGTIVVLVTSPSFFSRILIAFQLYTVLLLIYLLFSLIKAVLRKKTEAWFVIISGAIFFGTVINDMLYYNEKSSIGNLYPLGVMVLAFTQAILILKRFTGAFSSVEILNQKLIDKDRLKNEFLDDVAHGFMTPISGMIGIAEALYDEKGGKLNEYQKESLGLIVSNGRRLANLVSDVQDFSKLKNRDIVLNLGNLDLNHVVNSVFAICKHLLNDKKIELINEIPPDVFYVKADENRIYQVFYNLIENAIKFTAAGKIGVSAFKKGHKIEVTVYDTGCGIPAEKLHGIFEPYVQASHSETLKYGGFGLGLSITKKLIELHGGIIEVQSQVNAGTKLIFTLPAGTKPAVSKSNDLSDVRKQTGISYLKSQKAGDRNRADKILVVDDEAINREVLKNHLIHEGYNVDAVGSGAEALAKIEAGIHYNLIILDIMMPEMSGYEVCQSLREKYNLIELPILVISVKNRAEDIQRVFNVGANDFLNRSFDKKELLARVKTLIMLKKSAKQALEAQIGFYQAQIKPHFLYNTLNSIMGLCLDQPEKAYEMLGEFSNYLRGKFGLQSMDSPIPLRDEINLIKAYLNIEKTRFGDRLSYEIDIGTDDNLLIPPLILQPLVENAVKHGIYHKEEGGKVKISIGQDKNELVFRVEDDGVGIDKANYIIEGNNKGIGLKNVNERLKLYHGEGLSIKSAPGEGTTVSLRIPV